MFSLCLKYEIPPCFPLEADLMIPRNVIITVIVICIVIIMLPSRHQGRIEDSSFGGLLINSSLPLWTDLNPDFNQVILKNCKMI